MTPNDYKILCVDDHADAESLLERHLGRDFRCRTVSSAAAAIKAMEEDGPFAVVVSDYLMPGTDGLALFREIKSRWPEAVRVMITGDEKLDVAVAALNDANVFRFVRKPWEAEQIVSAVTDAAGHYQLVVNERHLREELARANAELDERLQDLDEANQLLEYWVEFSPAVLYAFSLEAEGMRASYISKNFMRLTGFERTAAVIDANFWPERITPASRARYRECIAALARGEINHAVLEYVVTHKSGDPVTVVDSLRAVHDSDGTTVELVGAWMDVSARCGD